MKDSKFTGLVVAEGVNSNGTPWFLGSLESGDNVIIGRTEDEVSLAKSLGINHLRATKVNSKYLGTL